MVDVSCTAADFKIWLSGDTGTTVGSFLTSESFWSSLIEVFLNFIARGLASFRRRFLVDQVATSSSLIICVSVVSCEAKICCLRKTSSCSAFSFLTASSLCLSACRTPSRKSTSSLSKDRNWLLSRADSSNSACLAAVLGKKLQSIHTFRLAEQEANDSHSYLCWLAGHRRGSCHLPACRLPASAFS